MRRIGIGVVSGGLMATAAILIATAADEGPGPRPGGAGAMGVLVPAYFYPAGERLADWNRLAEAARSIPLEVILNPANGPGERTDPNYVAVVDALRRSGARILAYVDSDYGRRPIAAIEKDVRAYPTFYKVDGFFIDQMANTPEAVGHYRSIRWLIRRIDPRFRVVGNPGTLHTLPEYLDAADTLVIFEGSARAFAAYDPQASAAPWIAGHPPGRFAAIVYGVGSAPAARDALVRARRTGAGSVYVTDQKMPNPYLGLPPYWAEEAAAIRAMNEPPHPAPEKPQASPAPPDAARPGPGPSG
jgi:hypothetical protein